MDTTVHNQILSFYHENGWYSLSFDSSDDVKKAHRELIADGLLVQKNRISFRLSDIGIEAIRLGGYDAWLTNQKNEKEIKNILDNLTIENLEKSIFQLKYSCLFILLNALLSFLIAFLTK